MALEDSVDRQLQYLSTWDEFVVGEHQIWYMLQNNFENIHTYTAMYCFSPSGNAHEKVEHVNHWFILQINSSWIIGRSNGETFTPEARVWGRCDTLYHVTRSLIEHHSITWLFLGGCITLHYITINTTATEVCFLCSCFIWTPLQLLPVFTFRMKTASPLQLKSISGATTLHRGTAILFCQSFH